MSDTTKTLLKIIIILGLFVFGIGTFFAKNTLYYALGVILGTAVSAARVILLERTLNKSLDMPPEDAQNYTRLHYSLRMIGIIAVALIAVKIRIIDIVGFAIALLLVQPAVYIHGLLAKKEERQ